MNCITDDDIAKAMHRVLVAWHMADRSGSADDLADARRDRETVLAIIDEASSRTPAAKEKP